MAHPKPAGLELDDDRSFQEKFWTFERVAWVVLALIVAGALLGLAGMGGPFARTSISGPTGSIEYPRVARWQAGDEFKLTFPPGDTGQATVEIDKSFSDIFAIEDIQPAPSESYATGESQKLVFDLAPPAGEKTVVFHVRGMQPMLGKRTWIRIGDGPMLHFTRVVLP